MIPINLTKDRKNMYRGVMSVSKDVLLALLNYNSVASELLSNAKNFVQK